MRTILFSMLVSCLAPDKDSVEDTGAVQGNEPAGPSTLLAPVDPPSNGDCPDMTSSNTSTFQSSNEDRIVTMVVPENPTENMPLVYFFHGLMDPGSTPQPTEYMASGLGLQSMANELGIVFALPQSGVLTRMGFSFFMWSADEVEGSDVVLFDDIRSCASTDIGIDLTRVHAIGMSGGALFTTVIARDRGDTLASMVEMSGGSDVDMLTFDEPLSVYEQAAYQTPALLISGGETDIWPGGGLTLVDFNAATDNLADQLFEDGHFVVRCEHSQGHQIPMTALSAARLWVDSHQFEEPSSIKEAGIDSFSEFDGWCDLVD